MTDLTITSADVREICPELQSTDAAIDLLITVMTSKLDTCLSQSYADCIELGRTIKIYTVCHFATVASRTGQLKSRTYANGAAESYGNYVDGGRGLNASQFGENILLFDTAQCVINAFPAKAYQFIATAGTAGSRDTGFIFGED